MTKEEIIDKVKRLIKYCIECNHPSETEEVRNAWVTNKDLLQIFKKRLEINEKVFDQDIKILYFLNDNINILELNGIKKGLEEF